MMSHSLSFFGSGQNKSFKWNTIPQVQESKDEKNEHELRDLVKKEKNRSSLSSHLLRVYWETKTFQKFFPQFAPESDGDAHWCLIQVPHAKSWIVHPCGDCEARKNFGVGESSFCLNTDPSDSSQSQVWIEIPPHGPLKETAACLLDSLMRWSLKQKLFPGQLLFTTR